MKMNDDNPRFLDQEETAELLALLESRALEQEEDAQSVAAQLDGIFDDVPVYDEVRFFPAPDPADSSWRRTVPPAGRSRIGAFVVSVALVTSVGVLAFGAMSWFQRTDSAQEIVRTDTSRIDRLKQQEIELIALRESHLQTIALLQQQIAALDGKSSPGSGEKLSRLTAKLEEAIAEAQALEVAASLIVEQRGASERSSGSSPAEPEVEIEAPKVEPEEGSGPIEENPYDGVSLASVLNQAVSEKAYDVDSDKGSPAENGAIEELIKSAVKGPKADHNGSGKGGSTNSLPPEPSNVLPPRPEKSAVRAVLGSMAPAVRRCADEPYGRLVVELTVVGATGRVTKSRTIDSAHAGTAAGACAAKAVRLARFPKFAKDHVTIKFPYEL
jgi:hypothetical protein